MKAHQSFLQLFFIFQLTSLHSLAQSTLNVQATHVNPSCFGAQNGIISLLVSGGKGPYSVAWNNGSDQMELNNLRAGDYFWTIKDQNGNVNTGKIELTSPDPLSVQFSALTNNSINGTKALSNLNVSGGTPFSDEVKYIVKVDQRLINEKSDFSSQNEGKIYIVDAAECSISFPATIQSNQQVNSSNETIKASNYPVVKFIFPTIISVTHFLMANGN